jgi:hypothetical protein
MLEERPGNFPNSRLCWKKAVWMKEHPFISPDVDRLVYGGNDEPREDVTSGGGG